MKEKPALESRRVRTQPANVTGVSGGRAPGEDVGAGEAVIAGPPRIDRDCKARRADRQDFATRAASPLPFRITRVTRYFCAGQA